MNKFRFFLFAFIALSIAAGCKKDDETTPITPVDPVTPEPTIIKHMKSITTIEANPKTTKYEWDDKNRGTKITYHDGVYSSYAFNGNTITVKLYINDATYFFNGTGNLNSKGAIEKISGTLTIDGINYPYSFECQYDASGQLIKSTEKENEKTSVYEYIWKDGNLIQRKNFENGVLTYIVDMKYDTIENKSDFDIGTNFIESTFGTTGKRSKNLIKGYTQTRVSDNKLTSDVTYTYILDSDGYATKSTYYNAVYGITHQIQYSY